MSRLIQQFKKIENLTPENLAEALEFNGYPECVNSIRLRKINGYAFLKLTEVQISLWRLPIVHSRRLWSFIQQVNQDPTQFLLKPELNVRPPSANKPNFHKPMAGSATKSDSFLHKTKIVQQVLNLDGDTVPGTSTIRALKTQPQLLPKPPHLTLNINLNKGDTELHDEDDDNNDGYLSPVSNSNMPQNFTITSQEMLRSAPNRASFLNKFRQQNFENLNHRKESVENKYEAQKPFIHRARPLLPPPPINRNMKYEDDEENQELPEYTDVTEDDEPLPEYTAVLEEEEENNKNNTPAFHRVLPPIPPLPSNNLLRSRPRLPSSSDSDISSSSFLDETKLKSHSTSNLSTFQRKSPVNLPKPPDIFPKSHPDASVTAPLTTPRSNSSILLRPLPPPPLHPPTPKLRNVEPQQVEDEDDDEEMTDYSAVDLEKEPYYRETDRKGAILLLRGLENGAFLIRPSRQQKFICTFSILHPMKMFNLGVIKREDGTIGFEGVMPQHDQPQFYGVDDIVNYYSSHPLYISGQTLCLRNVLPQHRR